MIESTIMATASGPTNPENAGERKERARQPLAPVAAIILAAGGSTRMGSPKQLLPIQGEPMLRKVTEAVCAAELAQVVVVVGARAQSIRQAITDLDVDLVVNEAWREGMSSSVRAGIHALKSEIQAVLLVLADQPALSPSLLKDLVARYRTTGACIVAPFFENRRGNPVLFDRQLFAELASIEGDQGGRTVVARYRDMIERLQIEDPRAFMDVDTEQDYQAMLSHGTDR